MNDLSLSDYTEAVSETNSIKEELSALKFGLYGEVGSVLSFAKKAIREGSSRSFYYGSSLQEEMGDVLWYYISLLQFFEYKPDKFLSECFTNNSIQDGILIPTDFVSTPVAMAHIIKKDTKESTCLLFGENASKILILEKNNTDASEILKDFFISYLKVLVCYDLIFKEVIKYNIEKTKGRFAPVTNFKNLEFDSKCNKDEKIPDSFKIKIAEKSDGKTYMSMNDVYIGSPLTDNIEKNDFYRFHDIFHMANAAILHWSPTFRALIKHKRKSTPNIDEQQDSARAIVLEEGLSAWIFSIAKENNFFEGCDKLPFDFLKNVKHFVSGYEVEACPLWLWERCILDGYRVFREIKKRKCGIIYGDKVNRKISFEPLE